MKKLEQIMKIVEIRAHKSLLTKHLSLELNNHNKKEESRISTFEA
jgi:hypothetical protein